VTKWEGPSLASLAFIVNGRVFGELGKWVATWKITGLRWVPGP
jgi:hypothetical protein